MLTALFILLMIGVFGKLLVCSLKLAWGITRILVTLVFLPLVLIGMAFAGMIYLALPVLLVIGLLVFLSGRLE